MSSVSPEVEPPPVRKSPAVPWDPWMGFAFVLIIFFAAQIAAGLLLSIYPLFHHWTARQTTDWLTNSVIAQFFYILLAEAIIITAIVIFLRWYQTSFRRIGLRRPRWSDLGYGLAAVGPYFILYVLTVGVVSHLVPGLNVDQKQELGFSTVQGSGQLLLTFISLVVLPPITEEILVRGLLYSSLKKAMQLIPAAIVTSLLFAAAHLSEGGAAGPLYIAALDTFVLSLVLIYLREKTGGLYASMTLHALKNGIAFLALFVVHVH